MWRNKSDCSWRTWICVIHLTRSRSFNWTVRLENIIWILTSYRLWKLYNNLVCISALGVHLLMFNLWLKRIRYRAVKLWHLSSEIKVSWDQYSILDIIIILKIYWSYLSVTILWFIIITSCLISCSICFKINQFNLCKEI